MIKKLGYLLLLGLYMFCFQALFFAIITTLFL